MSGLQTYIVLVSGIMGIIFAIIAYMKTPAEIRNRLPQHIREEGVEYAPEYSFKEKGIKLLFVLLWFVPWFLLINNYFIPHLNENPKFLCQDFLGISVMIWAVILMLFLPTVLMWTLIVIETFQMLKIIKIEQFPLPGKKVLKQTELLRGKKAIKYAKFRLVALFTLMILIVLLAVLGYSIFREMIWKFDFNELCL